MMELEKALAARRSIRGYRSEPVPMGVLRHIFQSAQRAPSWCNIQPWRVHVTSGQTTSRLSTALRAAALADPAPRPDFPGPAEYPPPYRVHRIECAKALYGAMGVARDDRKARDDAWLRNFEAFGAPHIAIVSMNPVFGVYGALDVGCWLQSVLLCATSEGVATCAQASLAYYPDVVRAVFPLSAELRILVGIAMGYEDSSDAANGCRTDRSPVEENVEFV